MIRMGNGNYPPNYRFTDMVTERVNVEILGFKNKLKKTS